MSVKIMTRNLFDGKRAKIGYISMNGTILSSGTDYYGNEGTFVCPVKPKEKYVFNCRHDKIDELSDWAAWAFYKTDVINNTNMIGTRFGGMINSYIGYITLIEVPDNDNIKYMALSSRFIFNTTGVLFQLELGTKATPYVPHLLEIDRIVQKNASGMLEIRKVQQGDKIIYMK